MSMCILELISSGYELTKYFINRVVFARKREFTWSVSDCEELVGEVNHTTECVTDLFGFVDFELIILLHN